MVPNFSSMKFNYNVNLIFKRNMKLSQLYLQGSFVNSFNESRSQFFVNLNGGTNYLVTQFVKLMFSFKRL